MTVWHSLNKGWPWLLVVTASIGACGQTDHGAGDPSAAGRTGDDDEGLPAQGGATRLPIGTGGMMTGRAGNGLLPTGGTGGTGLVAMIPGVSETPVSVRCGAQACQSVKTLAPNVYVDPCCAAGSCGVDTEFLAAFGARFADECQATGQVGARDPSCPTSAPQALPYMGISLPVPGFAGCCRAESGTCGVIVDQLTVSGFAFASPQLGCVDAAPFFANTPGAACGSGTGGAGGGGTAGEGGVASGGEAGAANPVGGAG